MAHKLLNIEDGQATKRRRQFRVPNIEGKFGLGFMIGEKEVFFGVTIMPIIVEQVVKRRLLKTPKGTARVFNLD